MEGFGGQGRGAAGTRTQGACVEKADTPKADAQWGSLGPPWPTRLYRLSLPQ